MAHRAVSRARSRQQRFRADAGARGFRAAHALRHRAGPRRGLADLCIAFGRRRLWLRPGSADAWYSYVNGGIDRKSEPRVRHRAFGRQRAGRDAAARLDRRVQSRSRGRLCATVPPRSKRAPGWRPCSRANSPSPDFLDRALRAIAATTPEDVQRVARTYLGNPTIALVLPRRNAIWQLRRSVKVALVHDYLNQRGGGRARLRAYCRARGPKRRLHLALRRARRRAISFRPQRVRPSYLARVPLAEPIFSCARAVLSARLRIVRSYAATTRSSARRRRGRRACSFRREPCTSATSIP